MALLPRHNYWVEIYPIKEELEQIKEIVSDVCKNMNVDAIRLNDWNCMILAGKQLNDLIIRGNELNFKSGLHFHD